MKKIIALLLLFGGYCYSVAQTNLVPNNSFENFTYCPDDASLIDSVPSWFNVDYSLSSADYFNACAGSTLLSYGVPQNWLGFQNANSGDAYAGIFAYNYGTNSNYELREYIETRIDSTLIEGRIYCVSFYVSLTIPPLLTYNKVAISEIGMYLSDSIILGPSTSLLTLSPQVFSLPGVYLNDTSNWIEISGTYIAHGGERYIVIGNFKPYGQTDTIGVVNTSSLLNQAYYFIDDVSVVDCTGQGVGEIGDDGGLDIYPNPAGASLTLTLSKGEGIRQVKIFDVLGKEVLSQKLLNQNSKEVSVDVGVLVSGVYVVEATTERGLVRKKFVKE